jgi:hypothetical protein
MSSVIKLGLVEPSKLKNTLVMITIFTLAITSVLLLFITRSIMWIALIIYRPVHEHIVELIWERLK